MFRVSGIKHLCDFRDVDHVYCDEDADFMITYYPYEYHPMHGITDKFYSFSCQGHCGNFIVKDARHLVEDIKYAFFHELRNVAREV